MTIEYDPEKKRATHVETGLAVEFVRYGPHFSRERDVYFSVTWGGETREFEGSYSTGFAELSEQFPELGAADKFRKLVEMKKAKFTVGEIGLDIREIQKCTPEFPTAFVQALHRVATEERPNVNVSVYFKPFFNPADGEWSIEG